MPKTKFGSIYRVEETRVAPDTSDLTLDGDKVPEGMKCTVLFFSASDVTTASKKIQLGYKRAGAYCWVKTKTGLATDFSVILDTPITLFEGESVAAKIQSPTASDALSLYARGILE